MLTDSIVWVCRHVAMKARWAMKQWRVANRFDEQSISLKELKAWVANLQLKSTVKDIKDLMGVVRFDWFNPRLVSLEFCQTNMWLFSC